MEIPPLNEETGKPGTKLRSYEVTYDRAFVESFLEKTGESIESYRQNGGYVVPPGVFLGAYGRLIHESFHYTAGVHTSSEIRSLKPAPLGSHVTVTGEVVRLSERNGDKYVTFTVVVTGDDGTVYADIEHSSIYALRSRAAAAAG